MKLNITLLILVAGLAYGEGVVMFEKTTGAIQHREKEVLFRSDNGTVTTNVTILFKRTHPKETVAVNDMVMADQVVAGVDWTVYDLASYETSPEQPDNISELTGVVCMDVQGQQAKAAAVVASKAAHVADANAKLCALADSLGLTNRPVDFDQVAAAIEAMTETNPQMALMLSSKVQANLLFLSLNGGDARGVR